MDTSQSSESFELDQIIRKFSPYFGEVRKRIVFTLIVFTVAAIFGFIFYDTIIRALIKLLSLEGINIVFTSPFQFINLAISCGIASGLVFVFPLFIYQVLSFLKPALKRKEFKIILRFIPFSLVLFITGFTFGFLIMKWQIEIFLQKSIELGIGNVLDISRLISTVLIVSVLMGIAFQFPIILFLLLRIGIVNTSQLAKQRLWVYLGSLIFAILLPPDSILADIFLSIPLIALFELTLILNKIFMKK